ncbi:helix-turn-helix domain-containing protein [Embleya sp. NPDC020630]|uniref:MarR family transcriptional regulator n=1 Tax=Embleya sp. NPDC020630 TaxID=3363979 RepID=UPI0037A659CB
MPENTRTQSAERLCTILADTASSDEFTARALSEATGLGRSTVTKLLAHLEAEGAVYRENPPRVNGRPQPALWRQAQGATTAPKPTAADPTADPDTATDGNPTPDVPEAADTDTQEPGDAATPDTRRPPTTDDFDPTDAGDTDQDAPAPAPARTGENTDPTGRPDETTPADAPTPAQSSKSRLRPGVLRDRVRAHLHDRPTGEFTPGEIARVLGRSSGAVANALAALVAHGDAILSCPKPRRYRAVPAAEVPEQATTG